MELKCKSCPTHPRLVVSGREWPEDAVCPVCDTLYDKETGITAEEFMAIVEAAGMDLEEEKEKIKRKPPKLPPYMRGIHRGGKQRVP